MWLLCEAYITYMYNRYPLPKYVPKLVTIFHSHEPSTADVLRHIQHTTHISRAGNEFSFLETKSNCIQLNVGQP